MLARETNTDKKGIWIEGAYGTGKSRVAWTLKSLLECSPEELNSYFDEYDNLKRQPDLRDKLLAHKGGVNLSRIESRPAGDSLGRYRFSIDIEGHIREERVQAAFIGLHRTCPQVRFLGSYPRLDARPTTVLAGTGDKDFVVARAWIE